MGILELGKTIRLDLTKDNYLEYNDTLNEIRERTVGEKLFVHNHNQIYYDNPARPLSDLEKNKGV